MKKELLTKFADLMTQKKIIALDDENGIRIDYNLNDEEMNEFLTLGERDVNDSDSFKNLVTDIVNTLVEQHKNTNTPPTSENT